MPKPDISTVLECLTRREIAPCQAIEALVATGMERGDAGETVLFSLGGSDIIETGPDGIQRYDGSGKLVSDIEKIMTEGWPVGEA